MLAAPLIAGNDLRKMPESVKAVLTQREVIAINQGRARRAGPAPCGQDGIETWVKPLAGGDWAVMLFNRNKQPRAVTLDWAQLKPDGRALQAQPGRRGHALPIARPVGGQDLGASGRTIQRASCQRRTSSCFDSRPALRPLLPCAA